MLHGKPSPVADAAYGLLHVDIDGVLVGDDVLER